MPSDHGHAMLWAPVRCFQHAPAVVSGRCRLGQRSRASSSHEPTRPPDRMKIHRLPYRADRAPCCAVAAFGCGSTGCRSVRPRSSTTGTPTATSAGHHDSVVQHDCTARRRPHRPRPSPTTRPTITTTTTTTTTTVADGAVSSPRFPAGNFSAGPTDLFVLSSDGDLELWSEALVLPVGPRTLVADYPDPFGPVNEGSGPNVIDHVAGDDRRHRHVRRLLRADLRQHPEQRRTPTTSAMIGVGYSPTLSPTGDLLGTANDYRDLADLDTIAPVRASTGSSTRARRTTYLNVADLIWSSQCNGHRR